MKLQISFIASVGILLCLLFACSQPKMMPAQGIESMPKAPGNYTPVPQQDPRDKLIREQTELLKLYEARIKELEAKVKGIPAP
jgi:hypothetical protein